MPLATCPAAPPFETLGLMEPSRSATPFTSAAWVFALPLTGYRMLAECGLGTGTTRWFPEVAQALAALRVGHTVVDGEVCVLDAAGRSDLQKLHERALRPSPEPLTSPAVMCLQDLLVWDGRDVRTLPWRERRRLLETLPLAGSAVLRLQRVTRAEGVWLCRQAWALGHEAIDARRTDAPYAAGPSIAWLRIAAAPAPALNLAAA